MNVCGEILYDEELIVRQNNFTKTNIKIILLDEPFILFSAGARVLCFLWPH